MGHFARWVLENPYTLGIIGYLLIVLPIMGIWAIHKYGWQHWAPFDRGHKKQYNTSVGRQDHSTLRNVAQLGRALALGARCRRFESCHSDCKTVANVLHWLNPPDVLNFHIDGFWGLSSVGRASALQAECQEFEPPRFHWMLMASLKPVGIYAYTAITQNVIDLKS